MRPHALLLAAVILLFSVSTAVAASNAPAPAGLAGSYTATLPNYPNLGLYKGLYMVVLGPGSTLANHIPGQGVYKFSASYVGHRITVGLGGDCTAPGIYTWTQHGMKLDIKKVRDSCSARATLLARRWTRLSR
jgi:hypothetical protein